MSVPKTSADFLQLVFFSLKHRYGNTLAFISKQNLASGQFDYLPNPRPQAFVSITLANCSEPKRFFLEVFDRSVTNAKLWVKIKHYLKYEASGAWGATGKDLPLVLMVCESADQVSELIHLAALPPNQKHSIMFVATTRAELEHVDTRPNIWQLINDPTKKLELHRLPDHPSTLPNKN